MANFMFVSLFALAVAVNAEAQCSNDQCSNEPDATSLLQTSATEVISSHASDFESTNDDAQNEPPPPPKDVAQKVCEAQCANTVCNTWAQSPNTGSHQMLSCMHTCHMRIAGEPQATCTAKCNRNGGSGCSLTSHGFTAHMCGVCSNWHSSSQAQHQSFLSNQDCMKGCHVQTPCEEQCADTACKDPSVGSNQQLSCAQTCQMRMAGQAPDTCKAQCNRNGGSGCHLTAHGFTATMCGDCADWPASTQVQKESFHHNKDCEKGCQVGELSSCQKQCAGTVCQDPAMGLNQQVSCMQACEMRVRGEGKVECGYRCARNGQSGCSLTVQGFTAQMCGMCPEYQAASQAVRQGFHTNEDCRKGCDVDVAPPAAPRIAGR